MEANPLIPFFIGCCITAYVLSPILLLIHELGHARAVARCSRRSAVHVGSSPALIKRRFRTFDLNFHPWIGTIDIGRCVYDPRGLTVGQLRTIATAGPYASIASAFFLSAVSIAVADATSVIFWTATTAAAIDWVAGIANLIPRRYDYGLLSDGAMMGRLQGLDANAVPYPLS